MEYTTKNKQELATVRAMAADLLDSKVVECRELTEGFFNVAYEVALADGRVAILKIAPDVSVPVMTYERNIMQSEVMAMRRVREELGNDKVPVPEILGFDDSRRICPAPYFFMEKLEGCSLVSAKERYSEAQMEDFHFRVGEMSRQINSLTNDFFGYPGQTAYQGKDWFDTFRRMLQAGVEDAARKDVDLKISISGLWEALERDREAFYEVRRPSLVHWDLWEGNIFVENEHIRGIIDWERCLWGDPLMEVGFRTYFDDKAFRRGYGWEELTGGQYRRALWYDIYTMLLASLEGAYRHYPTDEMYQWAVGILGEKLREVCGF